MNNWFSRYFHLPGPRELGWNEHDALGSRNLTPFQPGKTWEDWNEHVRHLMPVRFFLLHSVPYAWYPIEGKISRAFYWLQCHTMKKHRWHLLDFRGVDTIDKYTHGYMDPSTVMWLAAWAALRRYIEEGKPTLLEAEDFAAAPQDEDSQKCLRDQNDRLRELQELHAWWTVGRVEENAKEELLYEASNKARKGGDEKLYRAITKSWIDYASWREEHEEEQFLRLVKLRRYLWT